MRNTIAIAGLVFIIMRNFCLASHTVSVEYRQDALDYDMIKQHYVRTKVGIKSDYGEINAAVVKTTSNETKATWSFMNSSTFASIVCGHYYVHNAAGLLLGKPTSYSPDPFIINPPKKTSGISLCKSGNPEFAMYGMVASVYDSPQNKKVQLQVGISIRESYIKTDDAEKKLYPYSIGGLLSRDAREGLYGEPVTTRSYFALLTVQPLEYFTLQGCTYYTHVIHDNGRLLFDANDQGSSTVGSFGGYSLYAHYRHNVLSLFCEYAVSKKEIKKTERVNEYKSAYMCGITMQKKGIRMSCIVKKSNDEYYAPFSSTFGGNTPREVYYYSIRLQPISLLRISWAYIDQNNLLPSTYYVEYPHKRIHYINVHYKQKHISLLSDYRIAWFYKGGRENSVSRYQQAFRYGITKHSSLNAKGGMYSGGDNPWYAALGWGLRLDNFQKDISAMYAHSNGGKIYAAMLPLTHSNIISETIARSSFLFVVRISYRNTLCRLSLRMISKLGDEKETAGECSAVVWF